MAQTYKEFIRAFEIFARYEPDNKYPIGCEHDILYAAEIKPDKMSKEDVQELHELGWTFAPYLFRWKFDV